MGTDDWFLTAAERGNPAFRLPPWSAGNRVVAHVHGSAYFARLVEEVRALRPCPERMGLLTRAWAVPVYRLVYDPDGRPLRYRLRRRW